MINHLFGSRGGGSDRLAWSTAALAVVVGGGLVFGPLTGAAVGSPKKAEPAPAAQAQPASPSPASDGGVAAKDELQPTMHARTAGVRSCLTALQAVAKASIGGTYTAVSTWNQQASNDRMFSSIVGQANDNKVSPQAVSVLSTTPTGQSGCDSTAVEIHPSTLSCQEIERPLDDDKRQTKSSLSGIPMLQTDPSLRYILLPAPTSGCVVISVRTLYGP